MNAAVFTAITEITSAGKYDSSVAFSRAQFSL